MPRISEKQKLLDWYFNKSYVQHKVGLEMELVDTMAELTEATMGFQEYLDEPDVERNDDQSCVEILPKDCGLCGWKNERGIQR